MMDADLAEAKRNLHLKQGGFKHDAGSLSAGH